MLGSLVFPGIRPFTKDSNIPNTQTFHLPKATEERLFPLEISNAFTSDVQIVIFLNKKQELGVVKGKTKKIVKIPHSKVRATILHAYFNGRPLVTAKLGYAQKKIFLGGVTSLRVIGGFVPIRTDIPSIRIHNLLQRDITFNSGLLIPARKVVLFEGNERNGISLGFTFRNDQGLFTDVKITRLITDIYFGTVTNAPPVLFSSTTY